MNVNEFKMSLRLFNKRNFKSLTNYCSTSFLKLFEVFHAEFIHEANINENYSKVVERQKVFLFHLKPE